MQWQHLKLEGKTPGSLRAVIEVPKSARVKLAVDHERGFLALNDVLLSPMAWPAHYGFYPRTTCTDEDPCDVLLVASFDLPPLTVVETRLVGGMDVQYPEKGTERRYIAVCPDDPFFGRAHELKELPEEKVEELRRFYETYETADKRDLHVVRFVGHEAARHSLEEGKRKYQRRRAA